MSSSDEAPPNTPPPLSSSSDDGEETNSPQQEPPVQQNPPERPRPLSRVQQLQNEARDLVPVVPGQATWINEVLNPLEVQFNAEANIHREPEPEIQEMEIISSSSSSTQTEEEETDKEADHEEGDQGEEKDQDQGEDNEEEQEKPPNTEPYTGDKRPREDSGDKDDDSSRKKRKKDNLGAGSSKGSGNRVLGLVNPPCSYLDMLMNKRKHHIRLLRHWDFPFENRNSLQQFITRLLGQVNVSLRAFLEAVNKLCLRNEMTWIALGQNLPSLAVADRVLFSRICDNQSEDDDKNSAPFPPPTATSTGALMIHGSETGKKCKGNENMYNSEDEEIDKEKGKMREHEALKKGTNNEKICDPETQKKERMILVFEGTHKKNNLVLVVTGKPSKESEQKPYQDLEEYLRHADTDTKILMEYFVKKWLEMDLSVDQYLQIIKKLKRKYMRNLGIQTPHDEHLYTPSNIIWGGENPKMSEDEETMEGSKFDQQLGFGSGGERLEQKLGSGFGADGPEQQLGLVGFGSCKYLKNLSPVFLRSTVIEDPASWLRSVMAYNPVPMDSNQQNDTQPEEKKGG